MVDGVDHHIAPVKKKMLFTTMIGDGHLEARESTIANNNGITSMILKILASKQPLILKFKPLKEPGVLQFELLHRVSSTER